MASYRLRLFRAREGSIKEGLGTLTFEAGGDIAAITYARQMFQGELEGCDYAVIFDQRDKLVWEKGSALAYKADD